MSEEMDSGNSLSCREKPQNLDGLQDRKSIKESCSTDLSRNSGADNKRLARNRSRGSEIRSQREHSSDGVVTTSAKSTKTDVELCNEFQNNADGQRRESLNIDDNSPHTQSSFAKSLLSRSVRLPSTIAGATTRKCVLTLDGYSYVIVASSPENLTKKDDLSGNNLSTGCQLQQTARSAANSQQRAYPTSDKAAFANRQSQVIAGEGPDGTVLLVDAGTPSASTSSTATVSTAGGVGSDTKHDLLNITSPCGVYNTPESICSSTSITSDSSASTINGQVAKHGALTIVRRSNSRKNFCPHDNQQLYSTANTATPTSLASQALFGNPTTKASLSYNSNKNRIDDFLQQNNPTSSTPLSNASLAISANANTTSTATAQNIKKMLPTSPNSTNNALATGNDMEGTGEDFQPCTASVSTMSTSSIDLTTDNLPAVDTPDACDKAALRLRSLLHLLSTGEIQADVLQKNLHYAARVLEAVFLDESKTPPSGKSKLRQNSCSSVEYEDQSNRREHCNGHCKNVDCRQHEGRAHSSADPKASVESTENTSCSLLDNNAAASDHTVEVPTIHTQMLTNDQTSIDSRTKGVCSAPHTHGGPTGPPAESATEQQQTIETITCSSSSQSTPKSVSNSSVSSSSCSNKATIERQKRLRTPVWARSMSTNKTYINFS